MVAKLIRISAFGYLIHSHPFQSIIIPLLAKVVLRSLHIRCFRCFAGRHLARGIIPDHSLTQSLVPNLLHLQLESKENSTLRNYNMVGTDSEGGHPPECANVDTKIFDIAYATIYYRGILSCSMQNAKFRLSYLVDPRSSDHQGLP